MKKMIESGEEVVMENNVRTSLTKRKKIQKICRNFRKTKTSSYLK